MPEIIKDLLDQIKTILVPPQPICWQSFVLASLLCWLIGFVAPASWTHLLGALAWILLIVGLGWVTLDKGLTILGISTGPWIVGGLVCLFLSSIDTTGTQLPLIISLWPVISVTIAIGVELIQPNFKIDLPDPPGRQRLLIMLLVNLLLSCWLQFHFLVQSWVQKYPSLMADNFNNSAFVVKWQSSPDRPRGVVLLQLLEKQLRQRFQDEYTQLAQRPTAAPPTPTTLYQDITVMGNVVLNQFAKLDRSAEQSLWDLDIQPLPGQLASFRLSATWKGPTSSGKPYSLETTCQIVPPQRTRTGEVGITCDRPKLPFLSTPNQRPSPTPTP